MYYELSRGAEYSDKVLMSATAKELRRILISGGTGCRVGEERTRCR
jgi:hypothetical protein